MTEWSESRAWNPRSSPDHQLDLQHGNPDNFNSSTKLTSLRSISSICFYIYISTSIKCSVLVQQMNAGGRFNRTSFMNRSGNARTGKAKGCWHVYSSTDSSDISHLRYRLVSEAIPRNTMKVMIFNSVKFPSISSSQRKHCLSRPLSIHRNYGQSTECHPINGGVFLP